MRDGVVLRANVWRPNSEGPFPVLVYRTPYSKDAAETWYQTHLRAVERGYVVVLQDVRGRYASTGEFDPYRNEGRDGYDTIEWSSRQPWSNGAVGTYGLSYPGAVQWLAAIERPPHLVAMVPAMTFSSPRLFFYANGVFDLSWLAWIANSIAPDTRVRKRLAGPKTSEEAALAWRAQAARQRAFLPLAELPDLEQVAPYFYEWLHHPPEDDWWDWAEIRGRYEGVGAAVLNLSGWHDEAYGPEGAVTNFLGLMAARASEADPRTRLVIGPWVHGVAALSKRMTGDLDFGDAATLDYDELVLDWMDRYLRGIDNGIDRQPRVRLFVMGANRWRQAASWPPAGTSKLVLYLAPNPAGEGHGLLATAPPGTEDSLSLIVSDPMSPVEDPYPAFGPHDYRELATRSDVLVFETGPLASDTEITGAIAAEIFLSCDCRDTDLWVKVLEVEPDGAAFNLMSPGLDVLRASARDPAGRRALLQPGEVVLLRLENLLTSNLFERGHRLRIVVSTSFFPHFSRNLHTGASEATSSEARVARVMIHHEAGHASRLILPVLHD